MTHLPLPMASLLFLAQEVLDLVDAEPAQAGGTGDAHWRIGGVGFADEAAAADFAARIETRFGVALEAGDIAAGTVATAEQLIDVIYRRLA